MLNMHKDTILSICTAERKEFEDDDTCDHWYHSFLMLVDTSAPVPAVLQQLHYNDGPNLEFFPNVRIGIGQHSRFRSIKVATAIQGGVEDILSRWNYMMQYAFYLQHSGVKFGENYKHSLSDNNCRSAVISTLKSIGVDFQPELYADSAGTQSGSLPLGTIFDQANQNETVLSQLIQNNEKWRKILKADWIKGDRYVGSIPFDFMSMN